MITAARRGARVAHFPEGALSGYAGSDFETFAGFDWDRLGEATAEMAEYARRLGIWVVVGSAHRLSGAHKPHNSVYIVSDSGRFVERYDKRFCAGDPDGQRVTWPTTARAVTPASGPSTGSAAAR